MTFEILFGIFASCLIVLTVLGTLLAVTVMVQTLRELWR